MPQPIESNIDTQATENVITHDSVITKTDVNTEESSIAEVAEQTEVESTATEEKAEETVEETKEETTETEEQTQEETKVEDKSEEKTEEESKTEETTEPEKKEDAVEEKSEETTESDFGNDIVSEFEKLKGELDKKDAEIARLNKIIDARSDDMKSLQDRISKVLKHSEVKEPSEKEGVNITTKNSDKSYTNALAAAFKDIGE